MRHHPTDRAILLNALILRQPFGGVEKSVYELAKALCDLSISSAHAIRILKPRDPPARFFARSRRILREILLLPHHLRRDGVSLLHCPAYIAPPLSPCPYVLTIYDLHPYTHPQLCTFSNRLHYRLRLPRSIRRAAAIIVPSRHTRDQLIQLFPIARTKIHLIPLGVSRRYTDPITRDQRQALRSTYSLPNRYLLAIGSSAPRKNLNLIYKAWKSVREAHPGLGLVLAGTHTRKDRRLYPEANFPGFIEEKHMPALYVEATALVYPSQDEGFGLPALEAMATGCPLICARAGAMAEFTGDTAFLIDDLADPTYLIDIIRQLLDNSKDIQSRVERARQLALKYSWEATAKATYELYISLLKRGNGAPGGT